MSKLQRYNKKDYNQFIEFPVEIVGRDGEVRRYSFEESIRLYQKRISTARKRYELHDVVDAEIEHCSKRIAQLRRSYYARYGWESYHIEGEFPLHLSMDIAGELAAFLRRHFGCGSITGRAKLEPLIDSEDEICFVLTLGRACAGLGLGLSRACAGPGPRQKLLM